MMKRSKKIITLLAAVSLLAAALCGCSQGGNYTGKSSAGVTEYYLYNKDEDPVKPGTPDKTVDPASIYDSIEFIPEMLYGHYQVTGGDKAIKQYCSDMDYMEFTETDSAGNSRVRNITAIPYQFYAGPGNLNGQITRDDTHNWMNVYFMDDKGNLMMELFAYDVEGRTLKLVHLNSYDYDDKTDTLTYELDDSMRLEYEFSFEGLSMTLSKNGKSVRLDAGYNYGDEKNPHIYVEHYIRPGDDMPDSLYYLSLLRDRDIKYCRLYFGYTDKNGDNKTMRRAYGIMSEDGRFTFTIPYEDGEKTYQYAFFFLDRDGMILTDGTNIYKYMTGWSDYRDLKLRDVLDDDTDPGDISDDDAKDLIDTQDDILDELKDALEDNDIVADIDPDTGRVTMDTSILFATDSAEISDEGKANLDRFAKVYGDVIVRRINEGSVAEIIVEGHTDTNGTYEYNQELSMQRAQAVCDYCASVQPDMASYMNAKGFASDRPVYDASGNVDMAASRRVVFRFILNIKK